MSVTEFRMSLFYRLTADHREAVGVLSEGRTFSTDLGDEEIHGQITARLTRRVPLERVLVVRAREELFAGDFRATVIDAATAIELALAKILQAKLTAAKVAGPSRLKGFLRDTSNRHLVTVVGGLLGMETDDWREGVAAAIDVRHRLLHGGGRDASRDEAEQAVKHAEHLVVLAERAGIEP